MRCRRAPPDECGERTSEEVRIASLADLGRLLAEYEGPLSATNAPRGGVVAE